MTGVNQMAQAFGYGTMLVLVLAFLGRLRQGIKRWQVGPISEEHRRRLANRKAQVDFRQQVTSDWRQDW